MILPVELYGCETWCLAVNGLRTRVFEIRMPKGEEVTGECRNVQNEELHEMRSTTNIIRLIKSRWLGWAGNVARVRESNSDSLLERPGESGQFENLGVNGMKILMWI